MSMKIFKNDFDILYTVEKVLTGGIQWYYSRKQGLKLSPSKTRNSECQRANSVEYKIN